MKTWKIGLLIIAMLIFAAGCNTPKAVQKSEQSAKDAIEQVKVSAEQIIDESKNAVEQEIEAAKQNVEDQISKVLPKDTSNASKSKEIDFSKKHVRPAGEYIALRVGEYLVGRDFKPGRYFLYKENIDGNDLTVIYFYSEEKQSYHYPGSDVDVKFDAPSVMFENGQKIKVDWDSIILSTEYVPLEDFYELERPEGTYRAGTDIPVGSYMIFPTSFDSSQCVLFSSEEAYKKHDANLNDVYYGSYSSESYGAVVNIPEGSIFDVRGPIYMKKVEALKFD